MIHEHGHQGGEGLSMRDCILLAALVLLTAPLLTSCIQKGVVVQEQEVTFTFSETDEAFTDTGITKLFYAQIQGNFNDWQADEFQWHYLKFNDDGIPPDETAGDKRWTARISLPIERLISYNFLLVGLDADDEKVFEEINDPNNPQEDDDGNSLLIIQ